MIAQTRALRGPMSDPSDREVIERLPSAQDDLHAIASGGGALLLASIFGNSVNYAFGIFLARTLGPDAFGLYAIALTIFNIVTLTVVFGIDVGAMRFVSGHLEDRQPGRARETMVAAGAIALASGLLSAFTLAFLAVPLASSVYNRPELSNLLLCFSAAVPFAVLTAVFVSTLQAFQMMRALIAIKYVWEPAAKFVLAGAALWVGFGLSGVLAALFITIAASSAFALRSLYRIAQMQPGMSHTWNVREAKRLLGFCLPLAVSNLIGILAPRSDMLILGFWLPAQEVGAYLAALQTGATMALILGAFESAVAPILSRAWNGRHLTRMKDAFQSVSRLSTMASMPLFCLLLLFAKDILGIFGSEFEQAAVALMVLAAGQFFNNLSGSPNTILLMTGHSRVVMTNTALTGALLMGATLVLAPLWGLTGAAVAAAASFVLANVLRLAQVWRLHHLHPYSLGQVKACLAGVLAAGAIWLARHAAPDLPWTLYGIGLIVLYSCAIIVLGLHHEDRLMLQALSGRWRTRFPGREAYAQS